MPVLGIEHPMGMRQVEKDHFQRAHQEPRVSGTRGRTFQSLGAMDWLDGNAKRVTPSTQGSSEGHSNAAGDCGFPAGRADAQQ